MPTEVTASPPSVILQGWIPILTICVALLAPLGPAIFGVYIANRNASRARAAAEQVAEQLTATDAKTSRKLDTIHSLVNSRLTAALEKIDRLEERLFETEGRQPTGEDPPKPPDNPGPYPPGPAT
jgi:uncharacterized protein HemX